MSKNPVGRPPYEPNERDRNTITTMVAAGIPHENIARCIGEGGVDVKTLKKYYQKELETSADKANAAVAQSLFQQAKAGNTAAAIWWTKSRMGWREKTEVVNFDGGEAPKRSMNDYYSDVAAEDADKEE